MSRPVAGVRNKTVVVTLPGSPKGAKENLLSIIKLLPHACMQSAGGDSRTIHAGGIEKLEKDAGLTSPSTGHHDRQKAHCGHMLPRARTAPEKRLRSNDPHDGPINRYRESPYPMVSIENAIQLILKHTPSPKIVSMGVDAPLIGHVLAEDIPAKEAVPAYRASTVDGYAITVTADGPSPMGIFNVASISHASPGEVPALQPGQISRVTTGAPLPPGATSVVMVEDTNLISMTDDGEEEEEVEILTNQIECNENVREIGSDIQAGETILKKGEEITAVGGEMGLLASVGKIEVMVYKKPLIGVMSTGDEIVRHDRPGNLKLGEVRDCNRPTIMAAIHSWGFDVVDLGIVKDR